jgi:hypothetical protein
MATPSDVIAGRILDLKQELDGSITRHTRAANRNQFCLQGLVVIGILSSVIAGLGGISDQLKPKPLGVLALLPGVVAFIASTMRFQEQASRHTRYKEGLRALRERLLHQLPECPTADNVSAISKDSNSLRLQMQKEKDALAFNFAQIGQKHLPIPHDDD